MFSARVYAFTAWALLPPVGPDLLECLVREVHDRCGAGCVETAMTPLGAGPTPAPEVASPISRCAISLDERFLEGGIRTAPTP